MWLSNVTPDRLDRMGAVKSLELISPEAYLEGEPKAKCRYEYVAGRVYAMAGGSNTHNTIKTWLIGALVARLRGKPCQPFDSDTKVRIQHPGGTRFYYPDAMVVCQANPGREMYQDRPVVLVEVLSPSTRRDDEGPKRDDYFAIPTLAHYLLVETTAPRVTVFERTNGKIVSGVYEGLDAVIPLVAVGIELPLKEIYERVDWAEAADDERAENELIENGGWPAPDGPFKI